MPRELGILSEICHVPKGRVFAILRAMFISTLSFHRIYMEKGTYADLTVQ